MDVDIVPSVKREEMATPRSSDQDTISEPMEEVVANHGSAHDIPQHLRRYWDMAKRLNRKPRLPTYLGENEWFEIADLFVEFGHELSKFGLLDMELGLWENEIMHSKHEFSFRAHCRNYSCIGRMART